MKINDILSKYNDKKNKCREKRQECQEKIHHFEKRAEHYVGIAARMMQRAQACREEKSGYQYPDWIMTVLRPVIKLLNDELETDFQIRVDSPMGLRGEVPVNHDYRSEDEMSLIFTFDEGRLYVDNGEINDKEYKPGTIGAMNRFHYQREEVTDTETVIRILKKRFPHHFEKEEEL